MTCQQCSSTWTTRQCPLRTGRRRSTRLLTCPGQWQISCQWLLVMRQSQAQADSLSPSGRGGADSHEAADSDARSKEPTRRLGTKLTCQRRATGSARTALTCQLPRLPQARAKAHWHCNFKFNNLKLNGAGPVRVQALRPGLAQPAGMTHNLNDGAFSPRLGVRGRTGRTGRERPFAGRAARTAAASALPAAGATVAALPVAGGRAAGAASPRNAGFAQARVCTRARAAPVRGAAPPSQPASEAGAYLRVGPGRPTARRRRGGRRAQSQP